MYIMLYYDTLYHIIASCISLSLYIYIYIYTYIHTYPSELRRPSQTRAPRGTIRRRPRRRGARTGGTCSCLKPGVRQGESLV